jgi:aminopeptidase N
MHNLFTLLLISLPIFAVAQKKFTHEDSLRGSVTPERIWWDLLHYDLHVSIYPEGKCIEGSNTIRYVPISDGKRMQIDLQAPLEITRVIQHGRNLEWSKKGAHYFIELLDAQEVGKTDSIRIEYAGKPHQAKRAPWDGGFTWAKDEKGKEFIATSCQGIGASIWWPCKDHMYDEPDQGMLIRAEVPKNLVAVANGKLIATNELPKKRQEFVWQVVNPINNYGVNINVGDYVNFSEIYQGEKGPLEMSYWVLSENLEKAKVHFQQAPQMMKAFEHWFGPYPFYEDSYKIVEVPYLGMEHQSSVTYGNKYKQGYLGMDLSYSGWGLKFDYLIIHESGHEWFANNITYKDIADMWIHESFTTYSECLFVEYYYGKKAGAEYVIGSRKNINNKSKIIGEYDVNHEGDGDMYTKGANIIHTLRQFAEDDEHWRSILRGLNSDFYHQTVTTQQIEDYLSDYLGIDLQPFFDQYLRQANIPTLEFKRKNGVATYRWTNCIDSFDMPITVYINNEEHYFFPSVEASEFPLADDATLEVDPNFYVNTSIITE